MASAILLAAGVFAMTVLERSPSSRAARKDWDSPPNVVMIIIDTLRQDKLGAYGFPKPTSPEIDRMAAQGVRFSRVISQSSWTRPSIGSMLTSRYPRTLGIYNEKGDSLPDAETTVAEVLKEAGYTTLGATANANINSSFNFEQGFDHYLDSTVLLRWMRDVDGVPSQDGHKLQSARQIFDSLLTEVKAQRRPPYYVQANVMEVHEYFDEQMDLSRFEPLFEGLPSSRYLAAIRVVSDEIERFAKKLLELPDFERTLFVIVSDHGEGLTDHHPVGDSHGHGRLLYGSQVVVPLILYATDASLPRGKVVDTPCRLVDLMPTLMDYLGLEAPEQMEGVSMMAAVDGDEPVELPSQFVVETELRSSNAIGVHGVPWEYFEHREPHQGTDREELQRTGTPERGSRTNQLGQHSDEGGAMRLFLEAWEEEHPKAPPTAAGGPLHPLEKAQLRALGYLD